MTFTSNLTLVASSQAQAQETSGICVGLRTSPPSPSKSDTSWAPQSPVRLPPPTTPPPSHAAVGLDVMVPPEDEQQYEGETALLF